MSDRKSFWSKLKPSRKAFDSPRANTEEQRISDDDKPLLDYLAHVEFPGYEEATLRELARAQSVKSVLRNTARAMRTLSKGLKNSDQRVAMASWITIDAINDRSNKLISAMALHNLPGSGDRVANELIAAIGSTPPNGSIGTDRDLRTMALLRSSASGVTVGIILPKLAQIFEDEENDDFDMALACLAICEFKSLQGHDLVTQELADSFLAHMSNGILSAGDEGGSRPKLRARLLREFAEQ